jgi:hypothetical protein
MSNSKRAIIVDLGGVLIEWKMIRQRMWRLLGNSVLVLSISDRQSNCEKNWPGWGYPYRSSLRIEKLFRRGLVRNEYVE